MGQVQVMQHPWPSSPACVRVRCRCLGVCARAAVVSPCVCVHVVVVVVVCMLLFSVRVRVWRRVNNDTSSACACVHSVDDASHASVRVCVRR
jgi:hypothetical protein